MKIEVVEDSVANLHLLWTLLLLAAVAVIAFSAVVWKRQRTKATIDVNSNELRLQTSEQKDEIELLNGHQPKEEEQGMKAIFGDIDYKSDPVLLKTIRTKSAEEECKAISGITILGKELFIVTQLSSVVEVYDSNEISFIRLLEMKGLIDPWDIDSCNRNKCLYIMDGKYAGQPKKIWRVDRNGKSLNLWSTEDVWGQLSVTDESNVILTVSSENKLKEYSPDGQRLIREIKLSAMSFLERQKQVLHPQHAIKLTDRQFAFCHGFYGDRLHRVCLVDVDEKVQKSFGGERGSNDGQLFNPVSLAVDGNGSILVADQGNHRVLLLDSNLEFMREIVSERKHGIRYPWKICLDESNGRLFVVDNNSVDEKEVYLDGRVLIFDVKSNKTRSIPLNTIRHI